MLGQKSPLWPAPGRFDSSMSGLPIFASIDLNTLLFENVKAWRNIKSPCAPSPRWSTNMSETFAQFGNEQLGLLERCEVTTFRNLVPVKELRIRLIGPHLRWCEKVAFEDTHRHRQLEGHSDEILRETLVVESCRGCSSVGEPVQSNVV